MKPTEQQLRNAMEPIDKRITGEPGGWTQVPPVDDGDYWFACAKPWHSENAHDPGLFFLVRIKDGKRVAEADGPDVEWGPCGCTSEHRRDIGCPVWDGDCQHEMLAAWRPMRDGENFQTPPEPPQKVFERQPAECPKCGGSAAVYRMSDKNPWLCYSCGASGSVVKNFFAIQLRNSLMAALENP